MSYLLRSCQGIIKIIKANIYYVLYVPGIVPSPTHELTYLMPPMLSSQVKLNKVC